jgi:hypothetical protein
MSAWATVWTLIDESAIAGVMRGSAWLYPVVEVVHIAGFSVLVGSVAIFDLRVLGFGRSVAVQAAGSMLLPWSVMSLFAIVPAGLLLFSAHPNELAVNPVFKLKLLLIALAGLNALSFHLGVYRTAATWHASAPAPAQLHAAASLALWLGVITCGRFLAYS